jgi:phage gpG-like protein
MANASEYTISRRILARLGRTLNNPKPLVLALAKIVNSSCKKAFEVQRFGEIIWPARYPNQKSPKLNIAGAVRDLSEGPRIDARRFQDRPALKDQGHLKAAIHPVITGSSFEMAVAAPANNYAQVHQTGGKSKQAITSTIKANFEKYLESMKTKKGNFRKPGKKMAAGMAAQGLLGGGSMLYSTIVNRLGFLRTVNELVTTVNRRPFLGLTDEAKQHCMMTIQDAFPDAQRVH